MPGDGRGRPDEDEPARETPLAGDAPTDPFRHLREAAEKELESRTVKPTTDVQDQRRLVHELSVREIELEMQNEELRRSQVELEEASRRYRDLYDGAPFGYVHVDKSGTIIEANRTTEALLGHCRTDILGKKLARFFERTAADNLHIHLYRAFGSNVAASMEAQRKSGMPANPGVLRLDLQPDLTADPPQCRMTLIDVTTRVTAERELRRFKNELESEVLKRTAELALTNETLQRREQELMFIGDNLPALIAYVDISNTYRFANAAYKDWFGMTPAAVVGREVSDVHGDADANRVRPVLERALSGERGSAEFWIDAPRIGRRFIGLTCVPDLGENDGVRGAFSLITDFTERKAAEDEIRALNVKLERRATDAEQGVSDRDAEIHFIVDTALDGIITVSEHGEIESFNRAAEQMFGFATNEIVGKNAGVLLEEPFRSQFAGSLDTFRQTGEAEFAGTRVELTARRKNGELFPAELSISSSDRSRRFTGAVRDISHRLEAEHELRSERDFVENLIQTAPLAVLALDTQGRITRFNGHLAQLTGYSPDDVMGRDWFEEFIPRLWHPRTRGVFQDIVDGDERSGVINPIVGKDGRAIEIEWFNATLRDSRGEPIGVLSMGRDIQDRRRLEDALRYQARLIENVSDAVISASPDLTIRSWNRAATTLFGWLPNEAIGHHWFDLLPTSAQGASLTSEPQDVLRKEGRWTQEVVQQRKDGVSIHVAISASMATDSHNQPYIVAAVRDITELKELEEEFRHAQKMEAIGRLSSGIAHDFNNLLMGIAGCTDIARSKLEEESQAQPFLREINQAAVSGAAITRQLLAFSRKRASEQVPLDLVAILRTTRPMLQRLLGEDIELAWGLPRRKLWVLVDRGQLEQVLMNLVVNARDAMVGGGKLSVELDQIQLDGDASRRPGLRAGHYARFTVTDTGCGMTEAVRSRLFEPFFTTKPATEGTGLGLSTVYAIVTQAGGHIDVMSAVAQGTSFQILLPVVPAPARRPTPPPLAPIPFGAGRIALIVEDESLVRMTVRHYLEKWGFTVLDVGDGAEAIRVLEDLTDGVDLLLTDIVLPGLSGPAVAAEVTRRCPGVCAIYMSAHSEEQLRQNGRIDATATALQKPFSEEDLQARVARVLPPHE